MERNAAKKIDDAFGTPKSADSPTNGDNSKDEQTPEQEQKPARLTAKQGRKRKPRRMYLQSLKKQVVFENFLQ